VWIQKFKFCLNVLAQLKRCLFVTFAAPFFFEPIFSKKVVGRDPSVFFSIYGIFKRGLIQKRGFKMRKI
jgi:hypothetical protein